MPSVCEIKIELKKQGIKGLTGKNKAELEALLKSGKSDVKPKEKKPDKKPESKVKDIIKKFEKKADKKETKKEPKKPLLLKFKEEQEEQNNLAKKSYIYLKRKVQKIKAMIDDPSTEYGETENAKRLLKKYEDAMIKAKEKQYGNKKKK
tara:strand:- start:951 stop:1397 length:447 start_codon:yes stop_codon:yes gene_type:complete